MTPDEQYAATKAELWRRQSLNAENYDRAILTLSTAALGFSVTFLRDSSKCVVGVNVLWPSWWLFLGAIGVTVASYLVGQRSIEFQLDVLKRHKAGEQGVLDLPNRAGKWVNRLALAAGLLFIAAIVLTAIFATLNIGGDCMANRTPFRGVREGVPFTTDRPGPQNTTIRPPAPEQRGQPQVPLEPIFTPQHTPAQPSPDPSPTPPAKDSAFMTAPAATPELCIHCRKPIDPNDPNVVNLDQDKAYRHGTRRRLAHAGCNSGRQGDDKKGSDRRA